MGLKLVLPNVTFTDNTLPKLEKDPIICDGSLLLIDFSNSFCWDSVSLPTHGESVNNVAYDKAQNIIGSGNIQTLSPTYTINGFSGNESSEHKIEFTNNKGLHGIISQNPGISASKYVALPIPTLINNYIWDNIGDGGNPIKAFYVSLWARVTRGASGTNSILNIAGASIPSTNAFCTLQRIGWTGINSSLGYRNFLYSDPGNYFGNFATQEFAGTKGEKVSTNALNWGSYGEWRDFELTNNPSVVLYKLYIEDLTVSGRTYAEVDAIDYALWQEAFAEGGRFYDDTYTDPATIA